jgi:transcriptional regulator GlxA family with amidase domain
MTAPEPAASPVRVTLLALPETSGAALYGLYDVLTAVGHQWPEITGEAAAHPGFAVRIVAPCAAPFRCAGNVPVMPDAALAEAGDSDLVVISDLAVDMERDPRGRWPGAVRWVLESHRAGATVATVCTGSLLLADTGLLDGREATTHWAAVGLFESYYPTVRLCPQRILVPADPEQRIVTSGGASSWEDLVLHVIGRFCGEVEAVRTAKLFLLGDRSDGQLPYAAMARPRRHEDAAVAACQAWIAEHYAGANPVRRMVERSGLAERTFKRRFRRATGYAPVEYVQALRIEEAKHLLERTALAADEVAAEVGYEDPAFFRRLFKRRTGVTPARYRQRFAGLGRPRQGAAPPEDFD